MNDTKERILKTGLKHFLDTGYDGTSIQTITKEVGISKSTFFHHFKTKDELFNEIFLMCKNLYSKHLKVDDMFSDDSYHLIKEMYIFSKEYKDELIFMTSFENSQHISDESRKKGVTMNQTFNDFIIEGQKNGKIVELPPIYLCIFMANAVIHSLDYVFINDKFQEEEFHKFLNFITEAIKKH